MRLQTWPHLKQAAVAADSALVVVATLASSADRAGTGPVIALELLVGAAGAVAAMPVVGPAVQLVTNAGAWGTTLAAALGLDERLSDLASFHIIGHVAKKYRNRLGHVSLVHRVEVCEDITHEDHFTADSSCLTMCQLQTRKIAAVELLLGHMRRSGLQLYV